MPDLIIFIVAIVLIVFLAFTVARMSLKYKNSLKSIVKVTIENNILKEKLATALLENAHAKSNDDGFVKFLSESRDWAFNYIETVQTELNKINDVVSQEKKLFSDIKSLKKNDLELMLKRLLESLDGIQEILPKDEQ